MKTFRKIFSVFFGFMGKIWRHPQGRIGLIIALLLAFCAIFAPWVAPYDPYDVTQRAEKGLTPSLQHPLGTTITTGQDIFSMMIYGTRVSLLVGCKGNALNKIYENIMECPVNISLY